MDRVNWFVAKLRYFILGNLLPISSGILPWSMFPRRSRHSNEDRLYKEFGGFTREIVFADRKKLEATDAAKARRDGSLEMVDCKGQGSQ